MKSGIKHILVLLCICAFTAADATRVGAPLQSAWDAFINNNNKDARAGFTAALSDPATKAEAYMGLALIDWQNANTEAAFKDFQGFYKSSDNPFPYTYALWTSSCINEDFGKKPKEKLEFLEQLINDKRANGTMKALAHSMLGYHFQKIGQFNKSQEEFDQIGALIHWQVAGQFDNISGSGFNKEYGPLSDPKPSAVFKNKVGAEVKWYESKYTRHDGWFSFANHMSVENAILYSQTFVNSPTAQEVYLRAGVSGSLKVWVNDKLVLAKQEENNNDVDVYACKIKLNKGANRILLQVGASEVTSADFILRLTDVEGNYLKTLSSTAAYSEYSKAEEYTVEEIPFFAEQFFADKIKASPDNFLLHLMNAETCLRNDQIYEARVSLKKARLIAPKNSFLGLLRIRAFNIEDNTPDMTSEQEKIKSEDPDSHYALKQFMAESVKKEDIDAEERYLDKLENLYGTNESTELSRLSIAAKRKQIDGLMKMAEAGYKKYPDSYGYMSVKYAIETNGSKDLEKGNVVLKKYLKNNYKDDVLTAIADNDLKLGKTQEAFSLYTQRTVDFPYGVAFFNTLAQLYYQQQDYTNALKWQTKTIEMAPYYGFYWGKMGADYEALKRPDEAVEAYKKCIYYDPTNYSARKQLRLLSGKKDLFENFQKSDVYQLYKESPTATDYPEDNSIILLNDIQRVVYPEGASEEHTELLIKVFNPSGIDTWKEYSIAYNSYSQRLVVDKAEVLKANGNKVQAETRDNYLVFTSLEASDAIHISYRIENYNTGKLAQHFWDQVHFSYDLPAKIVRYSLIVPEKKEFKFNFRNSDKQPETKSFEDYKLYTWQTENAAAIKTEPYMPAFVDVATVLDISSLASWQYVASWYSDLASTKAKTDFEIKEAVATLFEGKKNLTELQKAKLIYGFIEKNISYSNVSFLHGPFVPQKASRTLNTKLGDCKDVSTLFVAMCKEVGLKANLVLVDTRSNGDYDLVLPSIDFNHCISKITLDGKDYFVELTSQKLSFGTMGTSLLNASGLIIPRTGDAPTTDLVKLNSNTRAINGSFRYTSIAFDNNDMGVSRKSVKTGDFATGIRSDFADIGAEKQEKEMTQAISSNFNNHIKLTKLNFKDLHTLSDTAEYFYSFNMSEAFTEVAGLKIFRLPWAEANSTLDFLSLEKRKYPFLQWAFSPLETAVEVITLEIPKGKAFAEAPKSVKYSCATADYSLTFVLAGNKLTATRKLVNKKDIVPSDKYTEFRDFYTKMMTADNQQLGFKTAATAAAVPGH
jgi:tetratricopeptide (TPR) repeat protein